MAEQSGRKRLSKETRCRGIDVSISISEDAFDAPTVFTELLGIEAEIPTENGITGPLRLGGRGKDDFRITGNVDYHPTKKAPHYHINVRATVSDQLVRPERSWPTVAQFFGTIGRGVRDPSAITGRAVGQHLYPSEWWNGMELPQPLPFGTDANRANAELTGLEVSYKAETGTERVILSAAKNHFVAVTAFALSGPVGEDFFEAIVRKSASIGERLFNQVAQLKET